MPFKIYSIESRKGGVGKTTIALNLAKVLLEEGPVLLLDCDITGTSLSEPTSNSLQWARSCNVVKGEDGTNLNMLSYFVDKFTNIEENKKKLNIKYDFRGKPTKYWPF